MIRRIIVSLITLITIVAFSSCQSSRLSMLTRGRHTGHIKWDFAVNKLRHGSESRDHSNIERQTVTSGHSTYFCEESIDGSPLGDVELENLIDESCRRDFSATNSDLKEGESLSKQIEASIISNSSEEEPVEEKTRKKFLFGGLFSIPATVIGLFFLQWAGFTSTNPTFLVFVIAIACIVIGIATISIYKKKKEDYSKLSKWTGIVSIALGLLNLLMMSLWLIYES